MEFLSRFTKFSNRPRKGQAIAEFAIVLPILLLVVYGLLEVGRAIFIYSAVNNASREAARFGSTYGLNPADVPRFQDCDGIRNAAMRSGFMLGLTNGDIVIEYDTGPGQAVFDTCDGAVDMAVSLTCGDRIGVTVTADFEPIVSIVPLDPYTFVSTSYRTFTGVISLDPDENFPCD